MSNFLHYLEHGIRACILGPEVIWQEDKDDEDGDENDKVFQCLKKLVEIMSTMEGIIVVATVKETKKK